MANIERLEHVDGLADINALLAQLSANIRPCTPELLQYVLESPTVELWVVREGARIVAMGELALVPRPEGIAARIEDVVVDAGERGKGLGKAIMQKLIERAKERNAGIILLSSKPSREAANAMYQKLGFQKHETNSYFLKL